VALGRGVAGEGQVVRAGVERLLEPQEVERRVGQHLLAPLALDPGRSAADQDHVARAPLPAVARRVDGQPGLVGVEVDRDVVDPDRRLAPLPDLDRVGGDGRGRDRARELDGGRHRGRPAVHGVEVGEELALGRAEVAVERQVEPAALGVAHDVGRHGQDPRLGVEAGVDRLARRIEVEVGAARRACGEPEQREALERTARASATVTHDRLPSGPGAV
jgi:hypothetical protein